jgi:hypothetical protein
VVEKVKLIAIKDSYYTIYVFKKLEGEGYIMCTKLPNWQTPDVTLGSEGFLHYQNVKAGETYYNPATDKKETYKYSNIYFINFILETDISNNEIIF